MKIYIFIASMALFAITNGVFVPPRPGYKRQHLLGAKECTWGPGYWCQNITTSASCHATKHCIDTVWIHLQLPPDTTSICQTCKDMVKQARDQLLSNDTQDLIKQVFEGSCALLHVKTIVKECDKLADEYIPELIDTLASQMNPQVVCSVAGLCNSERVHKLIEEAALEETGVEKPDRCEGCHSVVQLMESKFNKMTRDDVLQGFLHICGKLGSLSDACSNVVITYFTEIYQQIQENFNPSEVCLMAGECSAQFHTHANVEITPMSHIGYVLPKGGDDLPCDLCEQLVGHLRDLLVANTTESEFKLVLEGLCKQTKSFKTECLSIVDQYYNIIYTYLVDELKPKELCSLINICPRSESDIQGMMPLLPVETAEKAGKPEALPQKPLVHINLENGQTAVNPVVMDQLPIELLMPPHAQNIYNKEACVFCEYFLHYLQEAITDPKTEEGIKNAIDKACSRLPKSINSTCFEFVNTYEPALVAILAQEIDPSQVCPMIHVCPGENSRDVEVFMHQENNSPKCPMCLYAVTKLESMITDKNSEENIRNSLTKLCNHLPKSMADECQDFVKTYTNELVEMLMADLNPEEVCVYLKLCEDKSRKLPQDLPLPIIDFDTNFAQFGGDIRTNLIPDDTVNGQPIDKVGDKPACVLCEFVMEEIEDQLKDKKTDDEIKDVVYGVCKVMPASVKQECRDFIDQYADTIIQLLVQALEPSQICSMMHFCQNQFVNVMQGEILECAVCEGVVEAMKKILSNPKADHNIDHVLEKTCRALPKKFRSQCVAIVEKDGKVIIDMLIEDKVHPHQICHKIAICSAEVYRPTGFY